MPETVKQVQELTQRRISHCPACGYALEGLPLEGNCPECGRSYDQASFVFHGYGRGRHSTPGNATTRAAYAWAGLAAILLLLFMSTLWLNRRGIVEDAGAAVVMVLPFIAMFLHRSGNGFPGLVQIWVTPLGCGQKDELHTDPVWQRLMHFIGLPLALLFILFSNVAREGWVWTILLLCSFLLAMAVGAFDKRQKRARLVKSHILSAPDLTAWKTVQRISIDHLSDQRYRIQVTAIDDRREVIPVDAEVDCSKEQAADVRRQVEQWIQKSQFSNPSPIP